MTLLGVLASAHITPGVLRDSRIGLTVNRLTKKTDWSNASELAKGVVAKWKRDTSGSSGSSHNELPSPAKLEKDKKGKNESESPSAPSLSSSSGTTMFKLAVESYIFSNIVPFYRGVIRPD